MDGRLKVGFEKEDRLDRSRRIGWIDVDRICASSALIVGAGALGNEVAKNVALSGFKRVTILDFDRVERTNLARCAFFTELDAIQGKTKAECLASALASLAPSLAAEPLCARVEDVGAEVYSNHDLIFGCLDNFNARLHANSHSYAVGRPYIDAGMQGTLGRIFVSNPPGPCLECASNISHSKIAALHYSCTGSSVSIYKPPVAAEITTTSIVSALAVREGIRLLSKAAPPLEGCMIYYDGQKGTLENLEVDVDGRCPNHSRGPSSD